MILTVRAAAVALLGALMLSQASAGPIERACNRSDRDAANRRVCSCIQAVADQNLSGGDQRRAAKFFSDPDKAQDVRLSDTARDDAFWQRYMAFGELAEAYCAG
jgi:phytoene dehydrogenase-like protein